jgi:hypothetical protein
MSVLPDVPPKLTWKVPLPGGQRRLAEAVLYIAHRYASASFFGLVKLNKTVWRADFDSFAERGQPVTGRQYQRLPQGPAPVEMLPVLNEMQVAGLIRIERCRVFDLDERRPVAIAQPNLTLFSRSDIDYLDRAIATYWDKTGRETSDISHGVAWKSRSDGEPMPYELAYLSDVPISGKQKKALLEIALDNRWLSQ